MSLAWLWALALAEGEPFGGKEEAMERESDGRGIRGEEGKGSDVQTLIGGPVVRGAWCVMP